MEAAVLLVTPRSSSTPISPRLRLADTAVCLLYAVYIAFGSDKKLTLLQAQEQHRAYLESLPATSYPLKPTDDPAQVNEKQRVTEGGLEQR